MWRKQTRWAFATLACAMIVAVMTVAGKAETTSARSFVEGIYKNYSGANSKGVPLSNDATIRRYFAAPLADAMVGDFAAAQKANEVPTLDGDPFIDAQDWEITDVRIAVKPTGADRAVATVTMLNIKKPRTITLDLVNTEAGWRIAEIRAPSGSLRALYKLQ